MQRLVALLTGMPFGDGFAGLKGDSAEGTEEHIVGYLSFRRFGGSIVALNRTPNGVCKDRERTVAIDLFEGVVGLAARERETKFFAAGFGEDHDPLGGFWFWVVSCTQRRAVDSAALPSGLMHFD